jgi:general stress protein 26
MDKEIRDKIIGFLGLQKSRLGVVSTVSKEGKPESAFVYFAFDENLNIYFATRDNSRKYKNILENKDVAFAIATENPPQTLQLEGLASVHSETGDQKELFQELVGLASAKHFSAPIAQQSTGGLQFIMISPTWARSGNFEIRRHGDMFEEVELEK